METDRELVGYAPPIEPAVRKFRMTGLSNERRWAFVRDVVEGQAGREIESCALVCLDNGNVAIRIELRGEPA